MSNVRKPVTSLLLEGQVKTVCVVVGSEADDWQFRTFRHLPEYCGHLKWRCPQWPTTAFMHSSDRIRRWPVCRFRLECIADEAMIASDGRRYEPSLITIVE